MTPRDPRKTGQGATEAALQAVLDEAEELRRHWEHRIMAAAGVSPCPNRARKEYVHSEKCDAIADVVTSLLNAIEAHIAPSSGIEALPTPAREVCEPWCGQRWMDLCIDGVGHHQFMAGPISADEPCYCTPACRDAGHPLNPRPPV